jgi:uncharacterized membrane protein (DUF4010 family)
VNSIVWTNELRFLVALALGFLIGLERESNKTEHGRLYLGGVRTFPIISMLGYGCARLHEFGMGYVLAAGLVGVIALTVVAYNAKVKEGRPGATSEISLVLTFIIGGLTVLIDVWIAMTMGIVTTLLLSEKAQLEEYVDRLDRVGFLATLRFLLVTVIILPVLPDHAYTRFQLNPARIWQVVIMVSSVGYVGYLLSKKFGGRLGLELSGLLGGIVSSTAVSFSAGRLARRDPGRSPDALRTVLYASSMMYLRILILVAILNRSFLQPLSWKMVVLSAIGLILARTVRIPSRPAAPGNGETEVQNPFEIRPALLFAVLFVILSVATRLFTTYFGDTGTLALATVVGIGDVNPFILTLISGMGLPPEIVVDAVILAVMSNTIAKSIYFGTQAVNQRRETAWRFGLWAVLHIPLVFL